MEKDVPIERKALYNLLRMQWLQNPQMEVEPWQVEDLRAISLEELFDRLQQEEIWLDSTSFITFAEGNDTPEELSEQLLSDRELEAQDADKAFLIIFELWRRLLPEKQSLTIFCDQLDHLIFAYDQGEAPYSEEIQDILENLLTILVESTDEGNDPLEIFEAICSRCANDLESFFYDYISVLINDGQIDYASDLIDGLLDYVFDLKWFLLLKAKLLAFDNPSDTVEIVKDLIAENQAEPDIEFLLELLGVLIDLGDDTLFYQQAKEAASLVKSHEEFHELLNISWEYLQRNDRDEEAEKVKTLLDQLELKGPKGPFSSQSEEFLLFVTMLEC